MQRAGRKKGVGGCENHDVIELLVGGLVFERTEGIHGGRQRQHTLRRVTQRAFDRGVGGEVLLSIDRGAQ
jgi:hypothetical protein